MLFNILLIAVSFFIAIIIESMVLPRIIFIAEKKKLFDLPNKRKKHLKPIPRLGGISFTPVILLILLFSLVVRIRFFEEDNISIYERLYELILFICGLLMLYLLGAKDDLVGVKYGKKFIIQFLASLTIVTSGVYVNNLYGLFGFYEISDIVGIILSLFIITFTTNAINLIDGADGLAAGLSAVALTVFGIFFFFYDMFIYASLAFIALGVLVPFFYYNFFHKKRKIFMGDTGSLTLGFILSFMFLRLVNYPPVLEIVPSGQFLLVMSPLFIPLFDALKVMCVRIAMGKTPFQPDRNHIHHKLADLGFSKNKTVLVLLFAAVIIVVMNWVLLNFINCNVILILDLILAIIGNLIIYRKIRKKIERGELTVNL